MARFDEFAGAVKSGAKVIGKDLFREFQAQAVDDAREFLKRTEVELRQWTAQLARQELTPAEFEDLVRGQKDLAELHALTQKGIALAKLERFRRQLIDLVIGSAFRVFGGR